MWLAPVFRRICDQLLAVVDHKKSNMNPNNPFPDLREGNPKWRWQFSTEKQLLLQDLHEGRVTQEMTPEFVYNSRPQFQLTDRKLWAARLLTCKKKEKDDRKYAEEDTAGVAHDRKLYPQKTHNKYGKPIWHGSAAEEQLNKDIAKVGDKPAKKPAEFRQTNDAYKEFELSTFRGHIYQRQKILKYHNWRNEEKKTLTMDKKKRKKKKKKKATTSALLVASSSEEDDNS